MERCFEAKKCRMEECIFILPGILNELVVNWMKIRIRDYKRRKIKKLPSGTCEVVLFIIIGDSDVVRYL